MSEAFAARRLSIVPTAPAPRTSPSRYDVLLPLASGGMGTVSVARHRGEGGFHHLVALKRLHGSLQADPAFVNTFLEEARFAAAIQHPNVVPVLDVGFDGSHFLAMEYVPSEPLSNLAKICHDEKVQLPHAFAARFIADASAGLHAAHELVDAHGSPLQLVHRDVSPGNLLITTHGTCRVTDFGIAKARNSEYLTNVGTVKGKANYLSPEQVRGERADRRSDVFSLGIVLYELTTMRRLFSGKTPLEVMKAVDRCGICDPRRFVPGYPDALADVVLTALQRNPESRFQTAHEMRLALERAMETMPGARRDTDVIAFVRARIGRVLAERAQQIASTLRSLDGQSTAMPKRTPTAPVLAVVRPTPVKPPALPMPAQKAAPHRITTRPAIHAKPCAPIGSHRSPPRPMARIASVPPLSDRDEPKTEECAAPEITTEMPAPVVHPIASSASAAPPVSLNEAPMSVPLDPTPTRSERRLIARDPAPVAPQFPRIATPAAGMHTEALSTYGFTLEAQMRENAARTRRRVMLAAPVAFGAWLVALAIFHLTQGAPATTPTAEAPVAVSAPAAAAPTAIETPRTEHSGISVDALARAVQNGADAPVVAATPAARSHVRAHGRAHGRGRAHYARHASYRRRAGR